MSFMEIIYAKVPPFIYITVTYDLRFFEKGKVTQLHYHCHSNEFNAALFPLAADNDE